MLGRPSAAPKRATSASTTASRRTPREALTSTASPRLHERRPRAAAAAAALVEVVQRGRVDAGLARALDDLRARAGRRRPRRRPCRRAPGRARGAAPGRTARARACRPGSPRAAAPGSRRQGDHRRLERVGLGVVAVVEQHHAARRARRTSPRWRAGCSASAASAIASARDAERVRRAGGREEVRDEVRARQRQRDVDAAAADAQVEAHARRPCRARTRRRRRSARSRPNQTTRPAKRSPIRRTRGSSPLSTAVPPRAEALEDLGLGVGDRVERGEELEVHRRHLRDHRHVGLARASRARGSRPAPTSPARARRRVCSGRRRSSVSGRPYWLLRLPSVFSTGPRVASSAAVISLVVVLPTEPVMPTTRDARRGAARSRARSARARGVSAHAHDRQPGRRSAARSITSGPRAARGRGGDEVVAVEARARGSRRTARRARSCASRSRRRRARAPAADSGTPCASVPPVASSTSASVSAARAHRRPPGDEARQHLARDLPVVEGHRALAQDLVGLVALAGDHHRRRPARPLASARAIASRRSAITSVSSAARPPGMPRRISSRIASGGSLRGLSEVSDDEVGEPRGHRAHQRALGAVAVAAAAEHA